MSVAGRIENAVRRTSTDRGRHIIEQTGLAAHEVMQELTVLSLKGLVKRTDGQQFARKVKA